MKKAIEIAASDVNEVPVGALIVNQKNEIVTSSANLNRKLSDPTAHAEIMVIRDLCKNLSSTNLSGHSIYITLEPCLMCATAISYSRLDAIYFGARDSKFGAIESNFNVFTSSKSLHRPEIYSGICEKECSDLIRSFFLEKRG